MTPTVAVIMTCHNRRPSTVAAIAHLRAQSVASSVRLPVFLTDDGSSDGTATAVLERFDHVQILQGDGSLYWAAGMAKAEAAAMAHDPDYLLWLNDDTMMDPDALEVMLRISADSPKAMTVGSDSYDVSWMGRGTCGSWPRSHKTARASSEGDGDAITHRRERGMRILPRVTRGLTAGGGGLYA